MLYTYYLQNKINDWLFRDVVWTPPTTLYFALMNTDGDEAGGGTAAALPRVGVVRNTTNFSAASSGLTLNNVKITFTTSAPALGVLVGVSVWDALTAGNMLMYGRFGDGPQTIPSTWPIEIKANRGKFYYDIGGVCS